jgi:hypothetical membrane protein
MIRRALLACGILSSLLYLATDILGGLRYEGYSFVNQAISELGAIGAPSKPLVDPLFLIYALLVLMFGIGLFREAWARNRSLRITAWMLIALGAVGLAVGIFAGPTLFAMRQRGTGSLATDSPHIILTGVQVLLLLSAIGFGALALGSRFRVYSIATLVTVIIFGVATSQYAPRLAAGLSTPGLGILERIDVYSSMLWVAVLGIALLKRPRLTLRRTEQ